MPPAPSSEPAIPAPLLTALQRGECAVIQQLATPDDAADRAVLLRLIELGFLPGESVRVLARVGRGGATVAVRLGGHSTFALRAREAALIGVRRQPVPEAA